MTRQKMEINCNINLDRVKFYPSRNGLYSFTDTARNGIYIIQEMDDYILVEESTNSVSHWFCDLSELME